MDRNKFLQKFREEADGQLLLIQKRLVDLELNPNSSDIINEIFRAAHTLKGNAKMLNLVQVSSLSHELENIFSELREGKLVVVEDTTNLLFDALDVLQSCVDSAVSPDKPQPDTSAIIQKLKHLTGEPPEAETLIQAQPAPVAPKILPPIPQVSPAMTEKFQNEGQRQLLLISQRLIDLERSPQDTQIIREIFQATHTLKGNSAMLGYVSIKNVAHELEEIFAAVREKGFILKPEMLDVLFEAIGYLEEALKRPPANEDTSTIQNSLKALLGAAPEEPVAPPPAEPAPVQHASTATTPGNRMEATSLSVNVAKLDDLMNITGELMLGKMEAESVLDKMRGLLDLLRQRQRTSMPVRNLINLTDRDPGEVMTVYELRETLVNVNHIDQQIEALLRNTFKEYEEHTNHLQNTVDELERNVLSIRMLQIATLFEEFRPFVRKTSRDLGRKTPNLIQTGNEIEVDKKVLEGIRDPLVHLVRNALDHGIEPPEERLAAGKPEEGRLVMAASQEGGYVYIRITDDGAGIDPERLRTKAIQKGIMSEARARNAPDSEIYNVIYEPGFSTSRIVTDNSGRGVGMDVVKRNIERLGGQVSVESEIGKGTTFTLKVPLTIATSRALLVKVEGQIYAIPAPNIEAMLYLTPDEIASRGGRDVVLHRNSVVPVVRLGDLIGKNPNEGHPLFVWQALSNEKLRHELVSTGLAVKTTNKNGNGYSNGNFKDNNRAPASLIGLTLADPEAHTFIQNMQDGSKAPATTRFNFERMPAVVVGSGDRRFCMLVDSLEDEVEIVVKSLSPLLRVQHVSSATILGDGRVIMILDVPNLISTARKLTSTNRKTYRRQSTDLQKKRILVVDDSITTRELEKSILEAAGYHVDTADDGVKALEVLAANSAYDLVVSDVEMPVMNGFELTTQIKNSPVLKSLPVIIVSSLNSEDHKRRGINAGAQAYITKGDFNQNNLLNTIEYLTS